MVNLTAEELALLEQFIERNRQWMRHAPGCRAPSRSQAFREILKRYLWFEALLQPGMLPPESLSIAGPESAPGVLRTRG